MAKSVTTRAIVKHLSISAQKVRADFRAKYDTKELHSKRKHEARMRPMACALQNIGEFVTAKVDDKIEFDEIQEEEITGGKCGIIGS